MYPAIPLIGYLCVLGGAASHTLVRSWKWVLIAFAAQSLGVGIVAWQISPLPLAIVKCVVGWLAAALIAITFSRDGAPRMEDRKRPFTAFFRAALLLLMVSAAFALGPAIGSIFHNPPSGILTMTGILLGVGILNIGLSEEPCRMAVNLLTIFQGFELSYLWMEQSLLLIGLLAAANLAIVLVMITLFSLGQSEQSSGSNA